jgi:hypothetical protein
MTLRSGLVRTSNTSRLRRLELRAQRATRPPAIQPVVEPVIEDEAAAQFFSSHPPEVLEIVVEPLVPPARRARFLRIVRLSVIACSLLCVAAAVRVAIAPGHGELHAAMRPTTPPSPTAPPVIAPSAPAPEPSMAEPPAAVAAVADPRWPDALSAKRAGIAALEARRLDDAIVACTSATILDPSDGEAWLVLGAAYQDKGKTAEALDAYRSCKAQGRVDPRGECAKMLRAYGIR